MFTFCSINFKESKPLVETSIDGRIILIGPNEVGCACTGNISLFQCNAKWRAFMLLTEIEQDWAGAEEYCCRPLYGEQSGDKKSAIYITYCVRKLVGLLRYPAFEISRFWDISLLRYPAFEISRFWDISLLRYPAFKISRFKLEILCTSQH